MTCLLCGKSASFCFHSRDYNRKISKDFFDHYHCPSCGAFFIAPVPANLGDYYPASYYAEPPSSDQLGARAVHERFKIDIVRKFVSGGRLLEIGPAYSCFPWLAKQAGFEVDVIEMNPLCCRFWTDVIGVRAINSSDTCQALEDLTSYNVIALWHVIEHLTEPLKTLEAISKKLLSGGILVIATPNPDAFQFRVLGKYWPHLDAPRHLTLVPAPLIIKKMKSLGFEIALVTTTDKGSLGWNAFGWEYFFSNMGSLRFIKILLRLIGRMVSIIMSPIDNIEGKGCAYTLVFRREGP